MPSQPSTLAWNITAALLLTISVTLVTDFVRRLLGADPDSLGILAIAVQAVLALVASSTFTSAGSVWLDALLGHFASYAQAKERWRCMMAVCLFAITGALWLWLPGLLCIYYNNQAFHALHDREDLSLASRDYQRAIALRPDYETAYLNLGVLYENSYQYDRSADQYKKAIVANPADATAYSQLARVSLMSGYTMTALRIANDGLALPSAASTDIAALHKNKAAAEYELGYYPAAIVDASAAQTAAGECVLGKVYAKLNQPDKAQAAWADFNKRVQAAKSQQPPLQYDPDCPILAGDIQ